jgi:hypothetical protein
MTCEGNTRKEDELEVTMQEVTGTFLLCQTKRQVTAFKSFYVRVINFTAAT